MKPKLVIADDEADIRRLIVFLLRSYDLYEAQNGRRALELIREVQPDLVLLDIMMPEMTGLEVLDAMREDRFYIFSHPEFKDELRELFDEILQDFRDYPVDPGYEKRTGFERMRRESYKQQRKGLKST